MSKYLFFLTAIFLIYISGCSTMTNQQSVSTPLILSQTDTPSPIGKLQLTFVKYKANLTEFYAMDVSCTEDEDLCFGEPNLLFKTLPDSNNSVDQPKGLIDGYSWSPKGDKIVLSAGKDIFIGNMNTHKWINISHTTNLEEYNPIWSANGRYIYYLSCSQEQGIGFCKLARYDLAENTSELLLDKINDSIVSFTISPDDQHVIFSISDGFDQLNQSDLDGSKLHRITSTNVEETAPTFSTNGNLVAYIRNNRPNITSNAKLESDIIVQDFTLNQEKNLTKEFSGVATSPIFSDNGKWIAFDASEQNGNYNIYAISVDHGSVIPVTNNTDDSIYPAWRFLGENK